MFAAIVSLTLLGISLGFGLGYAARILKVEVSPIVEEVSAMMPGSQCGQCGYPGCRPAAEAIVRGDAPITVCPPGGRALAEDLAAKLGVAVNLSDLADHVPMLARVSEATCIGCTRCFKACPTDAIVGAPKQLHLVIQDACTGCGSCVDVCPTECLQLHPIKETLRTWKWTKPEPELVAA
jgi:electron transport complex protein RnfB